MEAIHSPSMTCVLPDGGFVLRKVDAEGFAIAYIAMLPLQVANTKGPQFAAVLEHAACN